MKVESTRPKSADPSFFLFSRPARANTNSQAQLPAIQRLR